MTTAKSTLTLSNIASDNGLAWTRMSGPIGRGSIGGKDLEALSAGPRFSVGGNTLSSLDGLVYGDSNAHFSFTADSLGEWTYFHLTLVGKAGKSAYFELQLDGDDELTVGRTDKTLVGSKLVSVSGKKVWTDYPSEVLGDVRIIIKAMIGRNFIRGAAV